MAKEFIRRIVYFLSLVLFLLGTPRVVWAHLDPPGPPAFQEIIELIAVDVKDDMDREALSSKPDPGELFLEYEITQHRHETVRGRFPRVGATSLQAPAPNGRAVGWPLNPIVIYDHINCTPLDRAIVVNMTLKDVDGRVNEASGPVKLFIKSIFDGEIGAGNETFNFFVRTQTIRRPEYDERCKENAGGGSDRQSSPSAEDDSSETASREGIRRTDIESLLFGVKNDYRKPIMLAALAAGIGILVALAMIGRGKKKHKKGRR